MYTNTYNKPNKNDYTETLVSYYFNQLQKYIILQTVLIYNNLQNEKSLDEMNTI